MTDFNNIEEESNTDEPATLPVTASTTALEHDKNEVSSASDHGAANTEVSPILAASASTQHTSVPMPSDPTPRTTRLHCPSAFFVCTETAKTVGMLALTAAGSAAVAASGAAILNDAGYNYEVKNCAASAAVGAAILGFPVQLLMTACKQTTPFAQMAVSIACMAAYGALGATILDQENTPVAEAATAVGSAVIGGVALALAGLCTPRPK